MKVRAHRGQHFTLIADAGQVFAALTVLMAAHHLDADTATSLEIIQQTAQLAVGQAISGRMGQYCLPAGLDDPFNHSLERCPEVFHITHPAGPKEFFVGTA